MPPIPSFEACYRSSGVKERAAHSQSGYLMRIMGLLLVMALLSTVALMPKSASADIGPAKTLVPSAALVGEGRMTVLGFRIFDAALFAPSGSFKQNKPFALKLTYLRKFTGEAIAERTAKEMRRQGMKEGPRLTDWTLALKAILPNVSAGSSITGVRNNKAQTVLYANNQPIGQIADPEFTRRFFDIWLGSNTNDPALRNKLIGKGS
ncbi:chalcone isomerase family protein [Roseibium algae]|uniref:Chalcone isomerase family protein n=1 Tax=Roseibium algae TaxID=3123038 RepID=A0ABU8TEQ4_9HYPH